MEKNLQNMENTANSQAKESWVKPTVESLSVLENTLAVANTGTDASSQLT
jgi:hypothetical protein